MRVTHVNLYQGDVHKPIITKHVCDPETGKQSKFVVNIHVACPEGVFDVCIVLYAIFSLIIIAHCIVPNRQQPAFRYECLFTHTNHRQAK